MSQDVTTMTAGIVEERAPLALFEEWYADAQRREPVLPDAVAVATVDAGGQPSLRMVLLKGFDARGFVFYTNNESRKARELAVNPRIAMLFHWKALRRQVRIEGTVSPVSDAEADAYFASRTRGAQIGAWASDQSRPMESRFDLEKRVALQAARFVVGPVPRPPHWSGYRVAPARFEFWSDGKFRLHERLVFDRDGDAWRTSRLFP